ncbi:hypothetical protein GGR53DRAFT_43205 [Hypoxylon sp. FL1150]|nr:hypothetical protein GGR53DRAFT_43205 [Hypoxylon sp. FL1150]
MPPSSLKFVRKDSTHVVLTEHPDSIHPRELSDTLAARFGDKQFRISLRKNIYVIYVNAEAAGRQFDCPRNTQGHEMSFSMGCPGNYDQRLHDTKLAEKVLIDARILKR